MHEGEALGLLKALQWINDLGLDFVSSEPDRKSVVDHVKFTREDSTEYGLIIDQCKQLLLVKPNCNLEFVRREGNLVAHQPGPQRPLGFSQIC